MMRTKGIIVKSNTTLLVAAGYLCFLAGSAHGQTQKSDANSAGISDADVQMLRSDLRDQKKQIVAANLPLTGDEAAKFWPVYDAYSQQLANLNDQRVAIIKDYANNYRTMTDQQAGSLLRRWIQADQDASKLRLEWIPKFEAAVGEKKAAMFFQIDRRLALMLELQIASEVPLIQPKG